MCGIVGVLTHSSSQTAVLKTALRLLEHRGPDDRGIWKDHHIHLGHTRLSILDLSSLGHQPMSYQNGRLWITYNGEIYNYLELRQELVSLGHNFISQTDTEVLLAAYAHWGIECLKKLRGMFAFGIWDKEKETLFLSRDRIGEKPLYYWHDNKKLYFASELKALITLLPFRPKLDPAAVDLYLRYQYVPEPLTPLSEIVKLPAAHYILIQKTRWEIEPKPYWSLEHIEPVEGEPESLIRQELDRTIELILRSDAPVGVALSGGIDSGAIAALAAPKYRNTLQAFSVGYPGHPHYDERDQAKELATHLHLPWYEIELQTDKLVEFFPSLVAAIDEPIADIAAYSHYSVMKIAAERDIKVMLTGIGGDELFWGYDWVAKAAQMTERKQQYLKNSFIPWWGWSALFQFTNSSLYRKVAHSSILPKEFGKFMHKVAGKGYESSLLALQYPRQVFFYNLTRKLKQALSYGQKMYTENFAAQIPEGNPFLTFETDIKQCKNVPIRICQLLFDSWLVSNCISLGDRVSMASSVEIRLPLLDYKLIELVIGLRKMQPDHELNAKSWLRASLRGVLLDEVLKRPKRGFQPPGEEWMDAIIQTYRNWLETGYLLQRDIIVSHFLRKILDEFESNHQHRFMLYKLLYLETWYRKVVLQE